MKQNKSLKISSNKTNNIIKLIKKLFHRGAENFLRDYLAESTLFVRRMLTVLVGISSSILFLVYHLYQLQINQHQDYRTRSNDNRIKVLPIHPTRGTIYDCQGIPLAINKNYYQLTLTLNKVSSLAQTLKELSNIISLTNNELTQIKRDCRKLSNSIPIVIKKELSEVEIAKFAVNQFRFPGVSLQSYYRRYYPFANTASHVIGYVAKINEQEQQWLTQHGQKTNYAATQEIGKLGIERYYESLLHGKAGYEKVEINNRGRIIRKLQQEPPQAGQNLTLTINIHLQSYIEQLMRGYRGAVIAMDPQDGSILAMISSPSYDPNLFVGGIARNVYQKLSTDPDHPMINRATQGVYPPASTVKPFISVAALEEGIITHHSKLFDPGWWQLPGAEKRYLDWKRRGHGWINLSKALEESVDTFFYQVAYDMGIDRLSSWMQRFGYGQSSGIDLGEEYTGIMPTREWKIQRYQQPWYQGDTIPVGIGQGYWTATPIQMVKALTTLLNNGHVKMPHLLRLEKAIDVNIFADQAIVLQNDDFWQLAKDGMYGVANRANGTAVQSFYNTPYKAAVKSGTAQLFSLSNNNRYHINKLEKHLQDHALLIAFAPYKQPKIAVAIILENAGGGSKIAAPIVRKIFDYVLLDLQANKSVLPLAINGKKP